MLTDKLKAKEYYLQKLTMFVRNSYGIEETFDMFWKLLIDFDSTIETVFDTLQLSYHEDVDDLLNKIAELVGVKRNLDVSYYISGVLTRFTLNLTNLELIRLIRTRIIQNNYDGTYKTFSSNYKRIGIEVLVYDSTNSSEVSLVMNESEALTDNDKHLFLSGNYTVRSLGITYQHSVLNLEALALWDAITSTFDSSEWGE